MILQRRILGGITILFCIAMSTLSGCQPPSTTSDVYPQRPVKVIVPFAAGGGSDTFARIIQDAVDRHQLLPQPLVIINVPGAGGTIGSRRVKNARPDGYTLLLLHEGMLTAKHSGQAVYGPEAFTPIAGTGDATQVIAVGANAEWTNLNELMQAATAQPDSIVFSANIGAPSHFAGLMLEAEQVGAKFRYTQTGGGAKRFAALQGGHAEVSAFSIAEYVQFQSAGLNALALLGPTRHPDVDEVPTATEQGFDVISQNMQFWWAPPNTDASRIDVIAKAVCAAMQTPEVVEKLSEMRLEPTTLRDQALSDELSRRASRIEAVATTQTLPLPDFAVILFLCVVGFAILAIWRARRRIATTNQSMPRLSENWMRLVSVAGLTIVYVALLQWNVLGFVAATAGYAISLGGVLAWQQIHHAHKTRSRVLVSLVVVSFMMSVVVHALFTRLLVVDLP